MNNLDTRLFKQWQIGLGVATRCLDKLYSRIDDCLSIFIIGNWLNSRQNGQIDPEWLVSQRLAALNLLEKILGRRLRERGYDAQSPSVRYSLCEFG